MTDTQRKPLHIFAGLLVSARTDCGLTQQEVADFLHRSRRWYQKIEAGSAKPNWQDTILLVALFQLDTSAFAEEVGFHIPVPAHRK